MIRIHQGSCKIMMDSLIGDSVQFFQPTALARLTGDVDHSVSRAEDYSSVFQCPDLPPSFSITRTSLITMPRSIALHIS